MPEYHDTFMNSRQEHKQLKKSPVEMFVDAGNAYVASAGWKWYEKGGSHVEVLSEIGKI